MEQMVGMEQKRGQLTENVKQIAKDLLGYEIDVVELRLFPYIQYVMTNDQKIDPNKITPSERKILSKWRQKGYIEGGAAGLLITKEFWDIMCEIIFHSYVDLVEV